MKCTHLVLTFWMLSDYVVNTNANVCKTREGSGCHSWKTTRCTRTVRGGIDTLDHRVRSAELKAINDHVTSNSLPAIRKSSSTNGNKDTKITSLRPKETKAYSTHEGVIATNAQHLISSEGVTTTDTGLSSSESATTTKAQASNSSVTTTHTRVSTTSEVVAASNSPHLISTEGVSTTDVQNLSSHENATMTKTQATTSSATTNGTRASMTNTQNISRSENATTTKTKLAARNESCNDSMGLENGEIPDKSITSYDIYASNKETEYPPWYGRLNGPKIWLCEPNICGSKDTTPWIQADIGYLTWVTGVITQGGEWLYHNYYLIAIHNGWTTEINVSTFDVIDGEEAFIKDVDGKIKVFPANTDPDTPVNSIFPQPVHARIVRITCVSKFGEYCVMRFEILGCRM